MSSSTSSNNYAMTGTGSTIFVNDRGPQSGSSFWNLSKKTIPFWRTSNSKTPGSAKPSVKVRGAQHPPIRGPISRPSSQSVPSANTTTTSEEKKTVRAHTRGESLQAMSGNYAASSGQSMLNEHLQRKFGKSGIHEVMHETSCQQRIVRCESSTNANTTNTNASANTNANENKSHVHIESKQRSDLQTNGNSNMNMSLSSSESSANRPPAWEDIKTEEQRQLRKEFNKRNTLTKLMNEKSLPSDKFSTACWKGIPKDVRPDAWRLLLGYSPRNLLRRESTLANKRKRYRDLIELYYNDKKPEHRSNPENQIIHQIGLDVPRTSPVLKYFQIDNIKKLLTRALYIWSHHHTATGYVQGINDLITPFVYVFLDEFLRSKFGVAIEDGQSMKLISSLKEEELLDVEADSYWCLDEFLESLQLNYTHEQPGIQRMMQKFQCLVEECDSSFINYTQSSPVQERKLANHFKEQGVEFVQFSFRWMNCFLMREFTLQQIIYMWDTYLAEYHLNKDNVEQFHVFVCVALLLHFKKELINKDFADILLFIQDLPTRDWGEMQMSILMAEAQEKRLQWSMSARVSKKEVGTK